MPNTKKHVLAFAAAGAVMLGATTLSAAPVLSNAAALKAGPSDDLAQVRYRKHPGMRHQAARAQTWNGAQNWNQNWNSAGPLGWPFAAVEGAGTPAAIGAGTVAGAVVGGVTGYPYPYGAYRNGYGYGSYAYAPGGYPAGTYGGFGLAPDIGHSYYNGYGPSEPASQDNCAVDAGYGRKDYSIGC